MTEPQVWTLVGLFATIMIGVLGVVSVSFTRVVRAGFEGVNSRFDAVNVRFDSVERRLDSVERRLDGLDRDVTWLIRRETGLPPE